MTAASPFFTALKAGRDAFNARFEAARMRRPGLDPADVLLALDTHLRPVVEAVPPERAAAVLDALYDLALEATATSALGPSSRTPAVAVGWVTAMTALPRFVAAEPARLGRALLTALQTLDASGADTSGWAARLAELGPEAADTAALLDLGAVLAWTHGLAAYRSAALDAAARMEPALAVRALDLPEATDLGTALDRLRPNPWLRPDALARPEHLHVVAVCGDFSGFGGSFTRPPLVTAEEGRLIADDGEDRWALVADTFGHTFQRTGPSSTTAASTTAPFALDTGGTVRLGDTVQVFPELAGWVSAAATADTLAVSLADSHRLVLIGRTNAGPEHRPWRPV